MSDVVKGIKEYNEQSDAYLEILDNDGKESGIRFYAMPGGHEFNSFILALYNVARKYQVMMKI